jgi:hypothetical protein
MTRPLEERSIADLAAALNTLPVERDRAWRRVWGRVQALPAQRAARRQSFSAALSLGVLTVLLAFAQLGVAGALVEPAFASGLAPAPRTVAVTPASGLALAGLQPAAGTDAPPHVPALTPIPPPPGKP